MKACMQGSSGASQNSIEPYHLILAANVQGLRLSDCLASVTDSGAGCCKWQWKWKHNVAKPGRSRHSHRGTARGGQHVLRGRPRILTRTRKLAGIPSRQAKRRNDTSCECKLQGSGDSSSISSLTMLRVPFSEAGGDPKHFFDALAMSERDDRKAPCMLVYAYSIPICMMNLLQAVLLRHSACMIMNAFLWTHRKHMISTPNPAPCPFWGG